jgi:ATP-dependent Lhr-like helicase
MTRSARRVSFDPVPVEKLQLFLASLHGLSERSESVEGLQEILERLFFYPATVNAWEEYIIPSRMKVYHKSGLDNLTADFNLLGLGTGNKKITPLFPEDITFADKEQPNRSVDLDGLFRDKKAKYNFYDILSFSGLGSSELSDILWEHTWKGIISNDSFDSFRKGYLNGYSAEPAGIENSGKTMRKISFNRWKTSRPDSGNWFVIDQNNADQSDPIEIEELKKEKVRLLFKRYGIIFRQILENELPAFSWKTLLRSLRLMELSGEILTGYFFKGIPGIQFISFDAYRLLQENLPEDSIYWMNATDPVSLCGIKIDELKNNLPQRNHATIVVFHGSRKVLVSRSTFKKIDIFVTPDDPLLQEYYLFFKEHLTRQFDPVKKIFIEEINDESSLKSAYLPSLKKIGFKTHYKGLEMWKSF